jgi:cytochrome c peroxidase
LQLVKRGLFLTFFFAFCLFGLYNCKKEPVIQHNQNNDPDSLYQGTPYKITVPYRFPALTNHATDSLTYEGIQLGRRLFYDKHFSVDGQKACASCHKLQYALTDSGNALSTNEFGSTKRNAPPIENLAWGNKFFWDGRVSSLAAQAQNAYHGELGFNPSAAIAYLKTDSIYVRLFKKAFGRPGTITEPEVYNAVQQFMMSAVSANSRFDLIQQGILQFTSSEALGYQIFETETGDCFHCHTSGDGSTLLMTDNLFRNNGLDSAATVQDFVDPGLGGITFSNSDYGRFKDPSLRNIALTGPYMHDGRYKTLLQVINFYSDSLKLSPTIDNIMLLPNHANGGIHLSDYQKQNLLDFLYTLTDTSFIHNPNLTSPF